MKTTPIPFKKVPSLQELKAGFPGIRALFFDMDGTLFNTEAIHAEAMIQLAVKYQIRSPLSASQMHALMMGKADHLVFDIIKDWPGIPPHWSTAEHFIHEKNEGIIELLKTNPSDGWFAKEVLALLHEGKAHMDYMALITSSEKRVTEELLRLVGLDSFFNLVLTRDDTPHVKPDPWPYNKVRELSGFEKHEILIFEDSNVGLESATSSGCHVVKVEWY